MKVAGGLTKNLADVRLKRLGLLSVERRQIGGDGIEKHNV